jgi:hypothetical protein
MKKLLLAVFCLGSGLISKGQIYVDLSATGANTGTSWADAYVNLQSALANANSEDEIWVAQGIYKAPGESRTETFMTQPSVEEIKLYGGFAGNETSLEQRDFRENETVLTGDKLGNDTGLIEEPEPSRQDNCYNVLVIQSNDVLIDGFTITGGHANGEGVAQQNGAAIRKTQAPTKLTVRNCIIRDNFANTSAAGILFWIDAFTTSLVVEGSLFQNNTAQWATGIYAVILEDNPNSSMSVTVHGNIFADNTAIGLNSYGASAMWIRGLAENGSLNSSIINNTFYNNFDGKLSGQATFVTTTGVGAVPTSDLNTVYANNIHYGNNGADGSGLVSTTSIAPVVSGETLGSSSDLAVQHNLSNNSFLSVIDPASLWNNINADPLFADEANYDLRLQENSPARNAGTNAFLPADFTSDILGQPRVDDGVVDMGAYEYQTGLSTLQELSENQIGLYPNPANDFVHIQLPQNTKLQSAIVFDLTGKVVHESQRQNLDVSMLESGLYLVNITTDAGERLTSRFVKK